MTVKFTNNASTTVATGINTTATSLVVTSAAGFPTLSGSGDYCYLTIQQAAGTVREVVKATALSTNTFTIVRAQDGTSAGSWSVSDVVELRVTAALLTDIVDAATHDSSVLSVDSTNNRVGVNDTTPSVTLDISGTDAIALPVGTTAQRPSGSAGRFRYNSSLSQFEGYTDAWGAIGGGGTNTFTTDTFTANGSLVAFNLSQTVSSESNLLVFIDGVFQTQDAYAIATASGTTTLTFSAAPANSRKIVVYSVAAGISGSNLNIDSMTGDGSDVTLTLSIAPVNVNNTIVTIDGVYQSKSNYSISGTTLTFSTAPPTGTAVEVMTFTQTEINVPVDNTITSAKLSGPLTTPSDLTVTGTATATKLVSTDGVLELDDNGSHNGVINVPASLFINIDSDNGATGEDFVIAKDRTSTSGGTELFRVQEDGSVGIGTNSPSSYFSGATNLVISGSGDSGLTVASGTSSLARILFADGTSGTDRYRGYLVYSHADDSMQFAAASAEAMRLDSSGSLLINSTATADTGGIKLFSNSGVNAAPATSGTTQAGGALRLRGANNAVLDMGLNSVYTWIQATDKTSLAMAYPLTLNPNGGNVGIGNMLAGAALHVDTAANVTTGFGAPLIKVGGDNSWAGNGSLYSIGFGYVDNSISNKSPAEIGLVTTSNAGYTKGDLVFATRNGTANVAPAERMRVSAEGYVTKPYHPAFNAYHPAATSVGDVIICGTTRTNIGNHYSTTTGAFTAPVAGVYHFTFAILVSGADSTNYHRILFEINTSGTSPTYGDNLEEQAGSSYSSAVMSLTIYLNALDYIRIRNDGSATYGTNYGNFSGHLVG